MSVTEMLFTVAASSEGIAASAFGVVGNMPKSIITANSSEQIRFPACFISFPPLLFPVDKVHFNDQWIFRFSSPFSILEY